MTTSITNTTTFESIVSSINLEKVTGKFFTVNEKGELVKSYKTVKGTKPAIIKNPSLIVVETELVEKAQTELSKKAKKVLVGRVNINKIKFGKKASIEELEVHTKRVYKGRYELDFGTAISGTDYDLEAELGYDGHYWWALIVDTKENRTTSKRVRLDYFLNYLRLPKEFVNADKVEAKKPTKKVVAKKPTKKVVAIKPKAKKSTKKVSKPAKKAA